MTEEKAPTTGSVNKTPPETMTQEAILKEWEGLEYAVNADDTLTEADRCVIHTRQIDLERAMKEQP